MRTRDFAFVSLRYGRSGEEICTGYAMAASGRMQYDYKQTKKRCSESPQHILSFTQPFNPFTIHSVTFPLVTALIFCMYHSPPFEIMTRRCCPSPPTPYPSSTGTSRRYIHDEDLDDNFGTILEKYDDHRVANYEPDDETLCRPSREAISQRPSRHCFTSTLGMCVVATQLSPTSVQPLQPKRREINIVWEEDDECEPTPLASKKVLDYVYKRLNLPTNE